MKVRVLTFAQLKDFFEADFELELIEHANIAMLISNLKEKEPASEEVLASCRVAVNEQVVDSNTNLFDGATVAILPPSSGG